MKLWIDDVRPAPEGYMWCKSVNEAKEAIISYEQYISGVLDELDYYDLDYISCDDDGTIMIDTDHDAGDFACDGGDYIKLLDWLEETGRNYPICIHSMNPVGRQNMLAICQKNNWKVVY